MNKSYNKIFGIGLSRTGTTSLAEALKSIGVKCAHYPHDDKILLELKKADYRLSVLENYDAITDISVAPYFSQLDSIYPGSKFILTVRNIESWHSSIEEHFCRIEAMMHEDTPFGNFTRFICAAVYGSHYYSYERMDYVFRSHKSNVITYFEDNADSLLVLDICAKNKWDILSTFLEVERPKIDFPHIR